MKLLLLTMLVALHHSLVKAVCHCPVLGTGVYYTCGDSTCEYMRRKTCDDIESQTECEQANWELLNKRDTTIELVERIMKVALKKGELNGAQVGFIRTLLALAVEDDRPEGDCSNGLSTRFRVATEWNHCVSPELLKQCKKVADGVDDYLANISPRLARYVYSDKHWYPNVFGQASLTYLEASRTLGLLQGPNDTLHENLSEIIEVVRVYCGAKTARVRCASYDSTTDEMAGEPLDEDTGPSAGSIVAIVVSLSILFLLLVYSSIKKANSAPALAEQSRQANFLPSTRYAGSKAGYVFKDGPHGLGYYALFCSG